MIKKMGRLTLFLLFLGYSCLYSQTSARRVLVEVRDSSHRPIDKVKITVSSIERNPLRKEYFTTKRGQAAFLLPIEIKSADFILEKEGYQRHQESVELTKVRKLQDEMSYQIPFTLYLINELTPAQRLQKQDVDQRVLDSFAKGIELFNSGNFREAIAQFEKSVEVKADFLEAYQNLASSYFRVGEYEKAIETAQKALEIDQKPAQMIKLISVAYSKLGNENRALEYQEKLKYLPDAEFSAEELFNLGVVEANKGKDGEAAEYFEKAVLAKPEFGLAHYQLGLCYFRLNRLEGAKRELEKYLSMEPDGENAKTAKALLASIK